MAVNDEGATPIAAAALSLARQLDMELGPTTLYHSLQVRWTASSEKMPPSEQGTLTYSHG